MDQKITIQKAREILGERASKMTNDQIEQILNFLYSLCYKIADQSTFLNSNKSYDH
ncbi:hypothetical protein HY029_05905 [Candidatus Gottesmanbacteria bacterium]|nr:hypothetical protein [Candidatus Gottesmanbacteria bacterium]